MSRNIPTKGLGGPLVISEGYGRHGGTVIDEPKPGDVITDHISRTQSLFITQFRQTRDISDDTFVALAPAVTHTAPELPESGEPVTDHLARAESLFITQFRRHDV